jgi:hypothetical protein
MCWEAECSESWWAMLAGQGEEAAPDPAGGPPDRPPALGERFSPYLGPPAGLAAPPGASARLLGVVYTSGRGEFQNEMTEQEKPLTIMRIAWGVCIGNLIAALIIAIIYSGFNHH